MHHDRRHFRSPARRRGQRAGAVLLEILISIAIFVAAATFILRTTKNVLARVDRAQREQQAADLARSLLAELELGTLNLAALRDGLPTQLGSLDTFGEQMDLQADRTGRYWMVEIATERTAFSGLTLVELTVEEMDDTGSAVAGMDALVAGPDATRVRYTLRQMVELREAEAGEYQPDEALEDL